MTRLKIALSLLALASLPASATTDIYGRAITEDSRLLPLSVAHAAAMPTQPEPNGTFSLMPYVTHSVHGWSTAVAIGDVTGDGRSDVALVTGFTWEFPQPELYVFPQTITGDLWFPEVYPTNGRGLNQTVTLADLDRRGALDVLVGYASGIDRYQTTASGTLELEQRLTTRSARSVLALTRGGYGSGEYAPMDIFVGDPTLEFQLFVNYDDGDFRERFHSGSPYNITGKRGFVKGDFGLDGSDDIFFAARPSFPDPATIYMTEYASAGDQSGQLSGAFPALRSTCGSLDISDLGYGSKDGNGGFHLIGVGGGNGSSACLQDFRWVMSGGFVTTTTYPTHHNPNAVVVADMNLDGLDDVVVLHGGWNAVGVYLRTANDWLGPETLYPIPYASYYNTDGLAVGDFTGDGCPDVAIADYNNGLVTLEGSGCLAPIIFQNGFE